eukprot:TRINITY_DN65137_c0_g2_i1.p1 TRINITY_DN65137_c0_g2~~TRINITY_DN65137_c0_g2_i1.p1  ORF type:complete len:566 (-),score=67.27 TRINITY_DN65137_c0_g2_i1:203-1900(-)
MFFYTKVITRVGPMAKIWMSAHWDHKLTKSDVQMINLKDVIVEIEGGEVPLALRLSGELMLGVVRVFASKVRYLLLECEHIEKLTKTEMKKMAIKRIGIKRSRGKAGGMVMFPEMDIPESNRAEVDQFAFLARTEEHDMQPDGWKAYEDENYYCVQLDMGALPPDFQSQPQHDDKDRSSSSSSKSTPGVDRDAAPAQPISPEAIDLGVSGEPEPVPIPGEEVDPMVLELQPHPSPDHEIQKEQEQATTMTSTVTGTSESSPDDGKDKKAAQQDKTKKRKLQSDATTMIPSTEMKKRLHNPSATMRHDLHGPGSRIGFAAKKWETTSIRDRLPAIDTPIMPMLGNVWNQITSSIDERLSTSDDRKGSDVREPQQEQIVAQHQGGQPEQPQQDLPDLEQNFGGVPDVPQPLPDVDRFDDPLVPVNIPGEDQSPLPKATVGKVKAPTKEYKKTTSAHTMHEIQDAAKAEGAASFASLMKGKSRKEVAQSFFNLCCLQTAGRVNAKQAKPFADIVIEPKAGGTTTKPKAPSKGKGKKTKQQQQPPPLEEEPEDAFDMIDEPVGAVSQEV